MACPKIPNLDVKLEAAPDTNECTPDPEKAVVNCPEVMVKFGEVEITQTIELGYSLLEKQPTHLRAVRKGQASYDFKFSKPKYFAGSLVQIHDFFAATPIISAPETVTRKILTAPKTYVDLKLFKQPPWEHFGCTTNNILKSGWDFGDNDYNKNVDWLGAPIYDFSYNPADLEGIGSTSQSLRQNYLREANVLLGEKGVLITQEQKDKFKNYFNSKALAAVDYTNEMRILYALAATGQLPYDVYTRKYRIGNSKTNPGYDRTVKIVLNLYVKILRAEMASNAGSVLKEVKLDGVKYREAGVNHKKKSCLKVIVALNGEDTGDTKNGTYYFGTVWGKADASQTFSGLLADLPDKPAHGDGTAKSPGKTTAMAYKDGYKVQSDLTGEQLKKAKPNFVVFKDDLNPWKTRIVNRLNVINFWREERLIAGAKLYEWELREKIGAGQYNTIHRNLWAGTNGYAEPNRSKAIRIESPKVKTLADGIEVTPGLVLYANSGANVHMGTIAGSSFQTHMIFPLEAFSVFIDEGQYGRTTLETLPGKFMNFFSMPVLVMHWNVVQTVNDGATLYNNYIKAERLKEAAEKMKKYAEEVRAQMHKYVDALSQAFKDRDLAKYNQILGSMKALAADFAKKTGFTIPLDKAIQGGKDLKTFIDASNLLLNPPTPPPTPDPEPLPTPTPDKDDPTPEGPETTDLTPPAGGPSSVLVTDGLIVAINPEGGGTTSLPIDPVVFTPAIDTPQLGSTIMLGNIGHSEQTGPGFDQVGDVFKNVPGFDTNTDNNAGDFTWDIGDQ